MKKTIGILLALGLCVSAPVLAARTTSTAITHLTNVYQAYTGDSEGNVLTFNGYLEQGEDVITAVPGILSINPGTNWSNFVGAAQEGVPYTVKNVMLTKEVPEYVQCNGVFPTTRVVQQGTSNIRTWWPLMYEIPSTVFTLSILYGTPSLFDDDSAGPNPAGWAHVEQWQWHVDATLESLSSLITLFHELPFGKDQVPLVSDETVYTTLLEMLAAADTAYLAGDLPTSAAILADFELLVMDAVIYTSPAFPNPTGPSTGIAQTEENPAACKILIDIEYILQTSGIAQPKK